VTGAGNKVRRVPVLVFVLVVELMFVLLELAPSVTMLELQAMVLPTVNAKVATAAAPTVKTALMQELVVRAAIVTAVCKTGVMAMARAVTKVERAPVLAVTVLLDLMLDLVEKVLVATKFELGGMAPTTDNTRVATAAGHTATTTLMRVLVVRAAIVPEVGKMGVMAVTGAGNKVRRAPVLVFVLVLELMFVLLELAPSVAMLELQAMVAPQVNAKVATAAAPTVTTALMRVVVVLAAIVPEVCKMGVMAMARAVTKVERAPVLAMMVLVDLMLDLVEKVLVATKFELGGMAPTTDNTRVATAAALMTTTALYGVTAENTAVVPASVKTGVMVVLVVGAMVNSI